MFVHKRFKDDAQAERSLDNLAKAFLEQEQAEKRLLQILYLTQRAWTEAEHSPDGVARDVMDMSQELTEMARTEVARAQEKRKLAERIAMSSEFELSPQPTEAGE